jgi:hypothetical protein
MVDPHGWSAEPNEGPDAWIERLLEAVYAAPPPTEDMGDIADETCPAARCERERELAAARLAEWTV